MHIPTKKNLPMEDTIGEPHKIRWEAVIQIVRYLKAHPGCGLLYKANGHLRVEAYSDANWARSPSNRKSTT